MRVHAPCWCVCMCAQRIPATHAAPNFQRSCSGTSCVFHTHSIPWLPCFPASLQYLEWREKQYDQRTWVDVHGRDGSVLVKGALCYIASKSPANKNWLGSAPLEAIAAQVGAAFRGLRHAWPLLAAAGRGHRFVMGWCVLTGKACVSFIRDLMMPVTMPVTESLP